MANLKKNLKELQQHLDPGEAVEASVFGAYETKILGQDSLRNGIFAATNRRVVFYAKKLAGYDLESFPYENISSFEMGKGAMGHTIAFHASGNSGRMKFINQGDVAGLVQLVRSRMGKGQAVQQAPAALQTPVSAQMDPYEELKKLAELRDQGIVTSAEFDAKKAQLLGLSPASASVALAGAATVNAPTPPVGPEGWHPDPSGRHELRYSDGTQWTGHVSDSGTQSTDEVG